MGPPSKRKAKRRGRHWSTQLGFLFFSMLFLTLAIQRNNVNANTDDALHFDMSSTTTAAPNTSTTTHSGLNNITGEIAESAFFRFPFTYKPFVPPTRRDASSISVPKMAEAQKKMIYGGEFIIEKRFRLYITTGRRERSSDVIC